MIRMRRKILWASCFCFAAAFFLVLTLQVEGQGVGVCMGLLSNQDTVLSEERGDRHFPYQSVLYQEFLC